MEKFNCIAKKEKEYGDVMYNFELYISNNNEKKRVSWEWIAKEFDEEIQEIDSQPSGLLLIKSNVNSYLLSFGHAFFLAEKYCDKNFGFEFAKRITYEKIKSTTIINPYSRKNRIINTYTDNEDLDYDAGESFAKLKVKIENKDLIEYLKPTVEIGSSIKCTLKDDSIDIIIGLLILIEDILKRDIINKIPLFEKVKDEEMIQELDEIIYKSIDKNNLNLFISEVNIIGAIEVFSTNFDCYEFKYKNLSKEIFVLDNKELISFVDDNQIPLNEMLEIKVQFKYSNYSFKKRIYELIDYTIDTYKCILCNGVWYKYNDDYIEYLDEIISEIKFEMYESKYDFSKEQYEDYFKKQKEKDNSLTKSQLYYENAFNQKLQEDGFICEDRNLVTKNGYKVELMDLIKDDTIYAVKKGDASSKLCYAIEQSRSSLKILKSDHIEQFKKINNIGIWIILENRNHIEDENGYPDLSNLKMIAFKSSLVEWIKEVRLSGKNPVVRVNYKDDK